jgi:chorismate dehydratase
MDSASKTSNQLAAVLCSQYWHIDPMPVMTYQSDKAHARVIIGDRALQGSFGPYVYDLAEQWKAMTSLPFVFAVWVYNSDYAHADVLTRMIQQSMHMAHRHMDQIAALAAMQVGLSEFRCLQYLTQNLHYELGTDEYKAIKVFQQARKVIGLLNVNHSVHSACSA